MRLPAFVRYWLHDRYCCHPHELLDDPPPMSDYHEVPDGRGGTIIVAETKALTAFEMPPPGDVSGLRGLAELPRETIAHGVAAADAELAESMRDALDSPPDSP